MEKFFNADVAFLFDVLGDNVRLVGGAVRDYLLGRKPTDFDFATSLKPQQIIEICQKNHLAYKDYAVSYGTVSVIVKKKAYEITTLRTDVRCLGRHAEVAFSESYREDALRRDLTINAMYMDMRGAIFDYVGGFEDLQDRKLCFIGQARQRIEEDYLRLLRLFRFWAVLPDFSVDGDALEACCSCKGGLAQVSAERKTEELLKLLQGGSCVQVLAMMQKLEILPLLLPGADVKKLKGFLAGHPDADVWQKLAALTQKMPENLILSRAQKNKLQTLYGELT